MFHVNRIVGFFVSPIGIGIALVLLAFVASRFESRRMRFAGRTAAVLAVFWFWFWSTGLAGRMIGVSLEREFPPVAVEELPTADAIVILGGGTSEDTNVCKYAELWTSADRIWHGARIYRAGKAPKVFVNFESDAAFLEDLGVPKSAIVIDGTARNTEEEAKNIQPSTSNLQPKLILVTSAWHMRRAKLMFDRYASGVEVIPAATDYENLTLLGGDVGFGDFLPDAEALRRNAYAFKEWIGYFGYKWLRR